jgi:hypothetical protein
MRKSNPITLVRHKKTLQPFHPNTHSIASSDSTPQDSLIETILFTTSRPVTPILTPKDQENAYFVETLYQISHLTLLTNLVNGSNCHLLQTWTICIVSHGTGYSGRDQDLAVHFVGISPIMQLVYLIFFLSWTNGKELHFTRQIS